jgi:serine/threonine-protein kinase RsbW
MADVTLPEDTDIVLEVPAETEFIYVLRALAASVGARVDLPVDDIDDLRMAIDEASSQLLLLGTGGGTLVLRLRPVEGGMEALVTAPKAAGRWPPPAFQDTLAWNVLSGLTDEVELESTEQGPAIRILKRSSATRSA